MLPWNKTILDLSQRLADMAQELEVANNALGMEREKRISAEMIASERMDRIQDAQERAVKAEHARDEVLKLLQSQVVAAQSEKSTLDPKNYQPIHRKRRNDPWLNVELVQRVEQGKKKRNTVEVKSTNQVN